MRRLGKAMVLVATFATFAIAATPAAAQISLVSVPISGEGDYERLERLGVDVTHDVSPGAATVVLYDAGDRARLTEAGFTWTTVVADLQAKNSAERAEEADVSVPTALPSGRTTYRVYEDYLAEMNGLAAANPEFVRKVVIGETIEGEEIVGLELAADVAREDDGRPAYIQMGLHHAREWPSGEYPMEFAIDLVNGYNADDARVVDLLESARVFIFPVINVDGFEVSRGAASGDSGDVSGGLVAGEGEYRRKNCRPANATQAAMPCAQRPSNSGIDLNRNYGYYWGGPGSSSSLTAENYRGAGPFSEPESEAVHQFVAQIHPTVFISNHTFTEDGKWLRQPGFDADFMPQKFLPRYAASPLCAPKSIGGMGAFTPDEDAMLALGDDMALATGWKSELGYETLCDITGATEDWNYFGQGTYGYTPEARGPDFHSLYTTQVVAEYGDPGVPGVGVREAFMVAGERAANPVHHGIVQGPAPAGATLKLSKGFEAPTFSQPSLNVDEQLETTLVAPADGTYEWHVNPSDRPQISGGPPPDPGNETWTMTCTRPGSDQTFTKQVEVTRNQTVVVDWGGSECGAPPVGPNLPPVADFSVAPNPPVAGEEAVLTSTGTDSDGTIATTEWDLDDDGDFDDATGLVVTHTFASSGPQDVAVRVTDDDGDSDEEVKTVNVLAAPPPNLPPVAAFTWFPPNPGVGEDVTFESTSSDADGTITSVEWDLDGDGQHDDALGGQVTRAYTAPGTYEVSVRATDDDGDSDTATQDVVIGARPGAGHACLGAPATIVGTPGDDSLVGGPGRDVVVAMAGDDLVRAGGGADVICGRAGIDSLRGGKGPDQIIAGRGADELAGGPAADLLRGNKGPDLLLGGRGRDRCLGGAGADRRRGCP